MEFTFNVEKILSCNNEGFAILQSPQQSTNYKKTQFWNNQVEEVVNKMGQASAKAQGLGAIITTTSKILQTDNKMFVKAKDNTCIGFIKTGRKRLFIRNEYGHYKEIMPLCVLDFYVNESCQRSGQGKQIFEYMLANEKITPDKLAYDRPSPLLFGFLKKHYGLANYIPQNNNFVVFQQYFQQTLEETKSTQINQKQNDPSFNQQSAGARPPTFQNHLRKQQTQANLNSQKSYQSSNLQANNGKTISNTGRQIMSAAGSDRDIFKSTQNSQQIPQTTSNKQKQPNLSQNQSTYQSSNAIYGSFANKYRSSSQAADIRQNQNGLANQNFQTRNNYQYSQNKWSSSPPWALDYGDSNKVKIKP